jgi:AbrB family looped-hinge helix DNA binding protein
MTFSDIMANGTLLRYEVRMNDLMVKTKVREGGRIVIPAKVREALGMDIGEDVTMRVTDGELRIVTSKAALKRMRALVRKHVPEGVSLVDELIRERRKEAANE